MRKYKWICIWVGLSVVFAIIIHFAFSIPAPMKCLVHVWSAGDILTYVSTIALGLLAFWQNQKMHHESNKKEIRNLAIENFVLFAFEDVVVCYYDDDFDNKVPTKLANKGSGFNGNKAFWKLFSNTQRNMNIRIRIKNIGNFPATQIRITDKNGKKIENANVLHSADETNDKKFILSGDYGIIIVNIVLENLRREKKNSFHLSFSNPFGSAYSQEIVVSSPHPDDRMILIDAQCDLNIQE